MKLKAAFISTQYIKCKTKQWEALTAAEVAAKVGPEDVAEIREGWATLNNRFF